METYPWQYRICITTVMLHQTAPRLFCAKFDFPARKFMDTIREKSISLINYNLDALYRLCSLKWLHHHLLLRFHSITEHSFDFNWNLKISRLQNVSTLSGNSVYFRSSKMHRPLHRRETRRKNASQRKSTEKLKGCENSVSNHKRNDTLFPLLFG